MTESSKTGRKRPTLQTSSRGEGERREGQGNPASKQGNLKNQDVGPVWLKRIEIPFKYDLDLQTDDGEGIQMRLYDCGGARLREEDHLCSPALWREIAAVRKGWVPEADPFITGAMEEYIDLKTRSRLRDCINNKFDGDSWGDDQVPAIVSIWEIVDQDEERKGDRGKLWATVETDGEGPLIILAPRVADPGFLTLEVKRGDRQVTRGAVFQTVPALRKGSSWCSAEGETPYSPDGAKTCDAAGWSQDNGGEEHLDQSVGEQTKTQPPAPSAVRASASGATQVYRHLNSAPTQPKASHATPAPDMSEGTTSPGTQQEAVTLNPTLQGRLKQKKRKDQRRAEMIAYYK